MKYYYGESKKSPYFEGWYFKHVTEDHTILFIPGISLTSQRKEAFIQIIIDDNVVYVSYPIEQLTAKKDELYIKIGGNIFTKRGCRICIHNEQIQIEGIIRYGKLNLITYPIMGPLAPLSAILCGHSIFSMDHSIRGHLQVNGTTYEINGRGYIEGDHGHSFPEQYFWTQSNQFKRPFTSIVCAVASYTIKQTTLTGAFAVIHYRGKEYRFASYLGCKVKCCTQTEVILSQKDMELTMHMIKDNPITLIAPDHGAMSRKIKENVRSTVQYTLTIGTKVLIDEYVDRASYESTLR